MPLPTDPLLPQQWHLGNTIGFLDLNVRAAWNPSTGRAYTGAGVRAIVIDNGFDFTHSDLAPNYDTVWDYDFENDLETAFGFSDQSHGTATMGLLGADNNGTGAVGVAFDAHLIGYRTSDTISNDWLTQTAEAISNAWHSSAGNGAVVSISQSISNDDVSKFGAGYTWQLFLDIREQITNAVKFGRGGLGLTIVKAAGNARDDDYDVNADPWTNDTHQVIVAAVNQDGKVSDYSSYGAAVLVSAFGSPSAGEVVTLDRVGAAGDNNTDFVSDFNGTSAATPMVAGVVALMYEANPNLGWRDVQAILAASARHVGSAVDGVTITGNERYAWNWNGSQTWNNGGMHFSNDYGYGLVDAWAATRLAETWLIGRSAAEYDLNEFSNSVDMLNVFTGIPDGDLTGTTFSGFIDSTNVVERVTVRMNLQVQHIKDLDLYLISPSGKVSQLINDTGNDTGSDEFFGTWVFETQAFRGESAKGTWKVRVVDDRATEQTVVSDIVVTTFGWSEINNGDRYVFTNEYSNYADIAGHSTTLNDTDGGNDTINAAATSSGALIDLGLNELSIIDQVVMVMGTGTIENAVGTDFGDVLIGNNLANLLYGGRGNDQIEGGAGSDTAIYTGDRSSYSVVRLSTGEVRVEDLRTNHADGVDRVKEIENFRFTNGTKTLAQVIDITDFNLILTQNTTHQVRDWIFTNGAISANQVLGTAPTGWKIIATGDFNGDGIGDAIWRDSSTGAIREWLLNGSGGITANITLGAIAANWRILATGDYNGDGTSDLVWQNTSTGDTRIWMMANGALATNKVLTTISSQWKLQGTADFNGDGTYDILWHNTATGDIRTWSIVNGALTVNKALGSLSSQWSVAATGDFNHDGFGDLVWRNTSTGDTRIWEMVWDAGGGGLYRSVALGAAASSWKIIGSGDYTQDGSDDLIWTNTANGDTRLWDLVDSVRTSNTVIGTMPAGWTSVVNPATHSDFLAVV